MIGYLEGRVLSKQLDGTGCLLVVDKTGYEILLPKALQDELILDTSVALWIHTHVREDALILFGFANDADKQFFRVLLGVSGLGPKTALSLLSEHGASRLSSLIYAKDSDSISSAPGVGKKLAQKIILELSGKLEKLEWMKLVEKPALSSSSTYDTPPSLRSDLLSALTNLGYQPNTVKGTLDRVLEHPDTAHLGFEGVLRAALKELSVHTIGRELTGNG